MRFSRKLIAVHFAVLLITANAAHADDLAAFAVENRGASLQPPARSSAGTQLQGSVDVLAGDGDGTATLTVNQRWKNLVEGKYFRTQYKLSAPLDRDKTDQVEVGSLSDLVGGTTLGIEFSYVKAPKADAVRRKRIDAIRQQCDYVIDQLIPGYSELLLSGAGYNQGCSIAGLRDADALRNAVKQINKERATCKKKKDPKGQYCDALLAVEKDAALAMEFDDWVKTSSPLIERTVDEAVGPIGMFTLGLNVNEKKFDYIVPEAPTEQLSERENGWSASLAYTRINVDTIWAVGYTHEESYKAGQKAEICVPFGTTGALSCTERVVGAPTREKKELIFAEYRRFVLNDDVAISPRLEFDAEDSEWAFRVPVYLTGNKEGRLTAGVVFGWDEGNDAGAAVFIAKPLGFIE